MIFPDWLNTGTGSGEKTYIADNVLVFDIDPQDIEFTLDREVLEFSAESNALSFEAKAQEISFTGVVAEKIEFAKDKQTVTIISENADITFIGEEV